MGYRTTSNLIIGEDGNFFRGGAGPGHNFPLGGGAIFQPRGGPGGLRSGIFNVIFNNKGIN